MERKLHLSEKWLICLGIWGEAEFISRIWGAKERYFQGAEVLSFRDLGRSMHCFQESREHRSPWGPQHSLTLGLRSQKVIKYPLHCVT